MADKKLSKQKSLVLFEEAPIRRIWLEKEEKWYFSVIDIIAVLTDSVNPRDYWYKMKTRVDNEEKFQLSTICRQLKLQSQDGKMRETDCAHTEALFAKKNKAVGYDKNAVSAKKGGGVAKRARKDYELQTGQKVVSGDNFLVGKKKCKKLKA